MMQQAFRLTVQRAVTWSMASFVVAQVVRLGGNLILTKLLSPEYFGLMAIVYVLMSGLVLFSDVGLSQSVVRSARAHDLAFLHTAWTVQVVRGFGLWAIAAVIAVAIAIGQAADLMPPESAYANRQLPWVIAVYAVWAAILGAESLKLALARRELELKSLALVDMMGQVLALTAILIWASISPSIWALVFGGIVGAITRTVLSHTVVPGPRMAFRWERGATHEIVHFGKWIFLSSIVGFFGMNGDRLYLSGVLDERTLGIYSIAFMLAGAVQMAYLHIVGNVALPALSRVARDDHSAVRSAYYKLRSRLDMVVLPLAGLLFVLAPLIVHWLYDERYHDAGHMLRLLSLGLVVLRWQLADQCFIAMGHPRVSATLNALRLVALFIAMPVGFRLGGLDGCLLGIALHPLVTLPYLFRQQSVHGFFDGKFELLALPSYFVGMLAGWLALMALS